MAKGVAPVTPSDLIASSMRMKPDRVLLAELRGGEAFDFLKLLTTGHSGSITSFHAESCALASERYVFMCKENEQAAIYDTAALKRLVALTIDVIVHVTAKTAYEDGAAVRKERFVAEVHFDPVAKLQARFGDATLHQAASMSTQAKIAIALGILAYIVLGFFAIEYAAGAAYFLINKTSPVDVDLDTWATYWHWYSNDSLQRKHLQLAAGLAVILTYGVPIMIFAATRGKGRSLHGDARFATSAEVRKAKLFATQGIIVGRYEGQYLIYGGQQFVLLAAPDSFW